MAVSESVLLRRFAEHRDTEAFSEIVKRYADPIYNTCRRILIDEAGAADAAQETFYQLMCNANSVKGSLAAWLHSVATHKAVDAIRRNSARRSRERRYAFSRAKEVNQWKDLSPYIDKELEKLPPQHRDILMRYFFEGKTMTEIAELDKVSQPTVSRMVAAAVEALRTRLRKKGIIVATVVLGTLIEKNTLHAAPAVLLAETGKMSLLGTTTGLLTSSSGTCSAVAVGSAGSSSLLSSISATTAKTVVSTLFSTMKAKTLTAIAVTAIGTGSFVAYNHVSSSQQEPPSEVASGTAVKEEAITDNVNQAGSRLNQPIILSSHIGGGGMGGGISQVSTTKEEVPIQLTDPEATIETFTELLITDNLDLWRDCFTADSEVLADLHRIMNHPQNPKEQQLQNAFNSIGHPVELLELSGIENRFLMNLLYTVYDPFSIEEDNEILNWREGDQFEINAELINIDNKWKIKIIYPTYRQSTTEVIRANN